MGNSGRVPFRRRRGKGAGLHCVVRGGRAGEGRGGRGLEKTGDTFLMFNEGQLCYACLYMFVCPTLSCAVGWRWGIDR